MITYETFIKNKRVKVNEDYEYFKNNCLSSLDDALLRESKEISWNPCYVDVFIKTTNSCHDVAQEILTNGLNERGFNNFSIEIRDNFDEVGRWDTCLYAVIEIKENKND